MTVGFINPPYSAREDEGPMIFTVGVTGDHILERDIELSFSTVDGLIAGESLDALKLMIAGANYIPAIAFN